ncbi:MAG: transcription initiation factor IIB [Candidatus Lokiarchaeota archaeon]|nr:transcription initiation factor IIB [Candidatus Lokiarchaeota archaeon]
MVSKEVKPKETNTETCPDCGSMITVCDTHRGEIICSTCGLVISDKLIDKGPEWRAFDSDQREKRTRVGAPMTYTIHDRGLSTIIDWKNKDFAGHEIPAKLRSQIYRLRRWQSRIRVSDATERNLTFALSELDRMASVLSLPKTLRETAAKIYRSAVKSHLIRGRSIEGVAAASLYAACRMTKIPRTLQEIAETARVDKKEIGRSYRFVVSKLNLNSNPTKPIDYIARFVSELKLSSKVQKKAMEIVKYAEKRGLTSGRGPTGVAAASIYVASIMYKERRTQRDIARVSQVTEVTVRNRFKELITKLKINIPLKRK